MNFKKMKIALVVIFTFNLENWAVSKIVAPAQKLTVSEKEVVQFSIKEFQELEQSLFSLRENPSNYCNEQTESRLQSFRNYISQSRHFAFAEKFDCPQLLDLANQSIKMIKEESIQVASSSAQFSIQLPSGYVKTFTLNRPVSTCEFGQLIGCNPKNGVKVVPIAPSGQSSK